MPPFRRLIRRAPLAALIALAGVVATAAQAAAAVRICQGPVSSGVQEATTEAAARRLAMTAWTDAARGFGAAFTRWELASSRRIICGKSPTGTFRCVASGSPCGISQVPPDPRLLRKRTSPGIDA